MPNPQTVDIKFEKPFRLFYNFVNRKIASRDFGMGGS